MVIAQQKNKSETTLKKNADDFAKRYIADSKYPEKPKKVELKLCFSRGRDIL